jgi:hypothetical protein
VFDVRAEWTQLSLLPPTDTVFELTLTVHHLEGLATVSCVVTSEPTGETSAIRVWPAIPEDRVGAAMEDALATFTLLLRDVTGPF